MIGDRPGKVITIHGMVVKHSTVDGWPSFGCFATLPLDGGCPSRRWWLTILGKVGDHPLENWWPSFGRIVTIFWTILGLVGDNPVDCKWPSMAVAIWCQFCELSLSVKFQVCSTFPSCGWPSLGWWATIHGINHLVLVLWVKSQRLIPSL